MYGEHAIAMLEWFRNVKYRYMGKIAIFKEDIHAVTGTETTKKILESRDLTTK